LNDLPGMSKLIKLGNQCISLSSFSENEKWI
jgi:hypothetical protein